MNMDELKDIIGSEDMIEQMDVSLKAPKDPISIEIQILISVDSTIHSNGLQIHIDNMNTSSTSSKQFRQVFNNYFNEKRISKMCIYLDKIFTTYFIICKNDTRISITIIS